MPTWRRKPPNDHDFNSAARRARRCGADRDRADLCRRGVVLAAVPAQKVQTASPLRWRADGLPGRHMPSVAPHNHEAVRSWVMLGGRTYIPPANRVEYEMRRTPASMWFR
jgi:hypothetical protein